MKNQITNDEGESFIGELKVDVARLNAIRNGEDAGMDEEIANNPWLTKEIIISSLERSEKALKD